MSAIEKILVVHSEEDDIAIQGDDKGWVTNFFKFLSSLLLHMNYRDLLLESCSLSQLKKSELKKNIIVVLVVSPHLTVENKGYQMISSWLKQIANTQKALQDEVERCLIVHKIVFNFQNFPELLTLNHYQLYEIDNVTGMPREINRFFGSDAEKNYWMKLIDLSFDISRYLSSKSKKTEVKSTNKRARTVYLAEVGKDLIIQRDMMRRELRSHGFEVLPKNAITGNREEMEMTIKNNLSNVRLSLHLIGEDYGDSIEGHELSLVDLQNEMANEYSDNLIKENLKNDKKKQFGRLIWISQSIKNITERQKIFIENIKTEAALYEETEVLEVDLEEMKSIVIEEIETGGRFHSVNRDVSGYTEPSKTDSSKIIYLILDKEDIEEGQVIAKALKKQGFRVVQPIFEGELVDVRYIHQENLKRCDAAIIYFGNTSEAWIKTKLQDLMKSPGFGRVKKMIAKAVYFRDEKKIDSNYFKKNNTMILGEQAAFKLLHLKPFLELLEGKK
ncbi:MAG: hypothetical protein CMB93_04690 [Flammeovirgaceae bacterium]|jgi:hypothetical protein|nr:hypothetical protein [Flammeovirgaceae bacterium]